MDLMPFAVSGDLLLFPVAAIFWPAYINLSAEYKRIKLIPPHLLYILKLKQKEEAISLITGHSASIVAVFAFGDIASCSEGKFSVPLLNGDRKRPLDQF